MRHAITAFLVAFLFAMTTALPAQRLTTLHNFNLDDGEAPNGLVQAADGNFYGTTAGGGNSDNCPYNGCGTVFKITSDGILTTLYKFCSQANCPDGFSPESGVIQGTDGNFYGVTQWGGTHMGGTLFRISASGALTTLYNFCAQSNCADGGYPYGALLQADDGNFYGTTNVGGTGQGSPYAGTVFKITPGGVLTTLHNFCSKQNCADGAGPFAALINGADGNFYGTTYFGGGTNQCPNGCGTVFKITPEGTLTTLHSFVGYPVDGAYPAAPLMRATDGNFYGTTFWGGDSANCTGSNADGCGTVFKITPVGTLTTLHSFNHADGSSPETGLVEATDGYFYGTAFGAPYYGGGSSGTLYRITGNGAFDLLYSFCSQAYCSDGIGPWPLLQASDGLFYGTTLFGGIGYNCLQRCGTVFSLAVPVELSVAGAGGTISSVDGHIRCGSLCSYLYNEGARVTLSALPSPGYTFTGWTGCDQVNGSHCSVTMTEAKNIGAAFSNANVTLTSLTFKPNYVRGGQLSAGTLTLNAPAPQGGVTVALSSDHPGVAHPPSFVFVPEGKSSLSFAVNTFPVKSNTAVSITATAGSSHVSGPLTVGTTFLLQSIK